MRTMLMAPVIARTWEGMCSCAKQPIVVFGVWCLAAACWKLLVRSENGLFCVAQEARAMRTACGYVSGSAPAWFEWSGCPLTALKAYVARRGREKRNRIE